MATWPSCESPERNRTSFRAEAAFVNRRPQDRRACPATSLVAERQPVNALGDEFPHRVLDPVGVAVDLNDHDELRLDPMLAVLVGKTDPKGRTRRQERDRGKALAGKSTLNRLELTPPDATSENRYKKTVLDDGKAADFFVEAFVRSHRKCHNGCPDNRGKLRPERGETGEVEWGGL